MEIGKWYKDGQALFCLTKDSDISAMGYGFDAQGIWHDECEGWICQEEASKEEIESALRKEGERRGLWPDASIKCHIDNNSTDAINNGAYWAEWDSEKLWNRNGVIFYNGQWAEIVEEAKPKYIRQMLSCDWQFALPADKPIKAEKPTITILDSDRKELGKIYPINNKYYLHIGNEIVECSSVEDCLTKMD